MRSWYNIFTQQQVFFEKNIQLMPCFCPMFYLYSEISNSGHPKQRTRLKQWTKRLIPNVTIFFKITSQQWTPPNNGQIFQDPQVSVIQMFHCNPNSNRLILLVVKKIDAQFMPRYAKHRVVFEDMIHLSMRSCMFKASVILMYK